MRLGRKHYSVIVNATLKLFLCLCFGAWCFTASAQDSKPKRTNSQTFQNNDLVAAGHQFFGTLSRELALGIRKLTEQWGEPNAYILGQEGSAAFIGGIRMGEGRIYAANRLSADVFWQGPSLGFDAGGNGDRVMMLVYNLDTIPSLFRRFVGVSGSAYAIGGLTFTTLKAGDIVLVPIYSGVGFRLGLSVGYLKFTRKPTWNPF